MTEIINEPYPIDVPMWYIRDLMLMVVLAPLVFWCIKRGRLAFLSVTGILWFFSKHMLPEGGYFVLFSTALFFFSWGASFSIKSLNFAEQFQAVKYLPVIYIAIATVDTLTLSIWEYNTYLHNTGILIGVTSIIGTTAKMTAKGTCLPNPIIVNSTFFIYALHKIIIDDVAKITFTILHLPDKTYVMLNCYFLIPILTILICIIISLVLQYFCPKFHKALTGGR